MSKELFVIGMRRSGTSILRKLILTSNDVGPLWFEPHEFWYAVMLQKIKRYRIDSRWQNDIDRLLKGEPNKWVGAKFALNIGVNALEWQELPNRFCKAKFVFIIRNPQDTYLSWTRVDANSFRLVPEFLYRPFWKLITDTFKSFNNKHPERSCIIKYEQLVGNANVEMQKVWALLETESSVDLGKMVRKPRNWSANII